ncbi:MucR family transcriptional regulator [Sulfitobacter sp. M57]|uniref:MucR family transcriptional regulator n=1 Tax=unclassified Sulfitobacter TaxID=196795 RepID=UPI0023E2CDFD|nr:MULTISPECIES: MucR family transcriptional regulator [unclassified Sulfitobacter]MDF3414843.1 MucR family transcriptional regulator [Sulfitobacter sp. KE5]MDF3422324.1 MucR family transcriptional regulator [Sulfitobacter sp. KE43]MDF3433389.1 MucR family transcriptional regulator [Sulfitobacter sp. KE42]MDF3459029.1 MucR family transcriptional regulator [Sulfitobacter sp. S74]MDF3462928.1 MucR family transcriptional regulator [Sulfitobacter sp. Ks18]
MEDENAVLISNAVLQVLSSFASRENATVEDVLTLAGKLPAILDNREQSKPAISQVAAPATNTVKPAVAIEKSVSDDAVTCLCCGKSFTMLKRHLKAEHGLSENQYRAMFGLDDDHLLVAPNYSIRKAEYAKRIGLGKYTRDEPTGQDATSPL